jgi:hypothetical protein
MIYFNTHSRLKFRRKDNIASLRGLVKAATSALERLCNRLMSGPALAQKSDTTVGFAKVQ